MTTSVTGLSVIINQINVATQLSALDDAALLARFNNDSERITSFLLGFNLSFNAARIADLADEIENRLLSAAQQQLHN